MKRLVQFIRLTGSQRVLLMEAVAMLSGAGVLLRLLPFSRIARRLGAHMSETPDAADQHASQRAREVRWAVELAARNLPWHPVCLPQAMAAKWMLRRRGVESTLYLGVDPSAGLYAHAWLRAGPVIVTGGPVGPGFTVVSSFAESDPAGQPHPGG
jgi:hypothetical protein